MHNDYIHIYIYKYIKSSIKTLYIKSKCLKMKTWTPSNHWTPRWKPAPRSWTFHSQATANAWSHAKWDKALQCFQQTVLKEYAVNGVFIVDKLDIVKWSPKCIQCSSDLCDMSDMYALCSSSCCCVDISYVPILFFNLFAFTGKK